MNSQIRVAVLIVCVAAATQARAQFCELERISTHSEGEGVSAEFSSVDTSSCESGIETIVHVDAALGLVVIEDECGRRGHPSSTTETTEQINAVNVVVSVYDHCLGAELLHASGTGPADGLHLAQNFRTASLLATLKGRDGSGQPVTIAVDLVWSGVGHPEHDGDHVNDGGGTIVVFRYRSSGTMRDAVASGTVTVDGVDETPEPSMQGTIERNTSREFVEYR